MKRAGIVLAVTLVGCALALVLRDRIRADQAAVASASAAWSSLLNTDDRSHLPVLDDEAPETGPSDASPSTTPSTSASNDARPAPP